MGFAGATADAFTLFERFEGKLKEFSGDVLRSAVALAKDWRTDRMLRRLEALLLVADRERMLLLSGTGDVVEPEDGVPRDRIGRACMPMPQRRPALPMTTYSARQSPKNPLRTAASIRPTIRG